MKEGGECARREGGGREGSEGGREVGGRGGKEVGGRGVCKRGKWEGVDKGRKRMRGRELH